MKLEYKILWIENDYDWLDSKLELFRDEIEEYGFAIKVDKCKHFNELDKIAEKDPNLTTFDIMLIDFKLDNDQTGDKIIEKVREKKIYTDIIFYSTNSYEELQNLLLKKALEGVYTSKRDETFDDKFIDVFKKSIKKLLELNATRGLITSATSELDVMMHELTNHLTKDKRQDELDKIIDEYVKDYLEKNPENFYKKYQEIGFINSYQNIEAYRKWGIFRTLLKEYRKSNNDKQLTDFLEINKTYFDQVIDVRNKFAHAKSEERDGSLVLKGFIGKEDFIFNEEECIKIRKNLLEHRDNFSNLFKYFSIEFD